MQEKKVKKVRKGTFFGRLLRSPLFNGVLSALPLGKVLVNIKQTISSDPEHKGKNVFYILSYVATGVLIWLYIAGKIDQEKLNYLFSFVTKLL